MGIPSCVEQPHLLAAGMHWDALAAAPYKLDRSTWNTLGMNAIRDRAHYKFPNSHDYGACVGSRPLYEMRPKHCTLQPFDREEVCRRKLLGRQAVFVGDSTTAQLFLSTVLSLNGSLGRNSGMSSLEEATASACDDTLRLAFVRTDTLWYTEDLFTRDLVRRCTSQKANAWTQRASRDADVLVLGIGQHPAATLLHDERHLAWPSFVHNLNLTMASLLAARAAWGHSDSKRVAVVGATLPVPGCRDQYAPARSMAEASGRVESRLAATATLGRAKYADSWRANHRVNQLAEWLTRESGATFVDVAAVSMQRGDGAMGGPYGTTTLPEDCVHYCVRRRDSNSRRRAMPWPFIWPRCSYICLLSH